jgi:hypothetical protein
MKRERLTIEDKILIADNKDAVGATIKLMWSVVARHADKLLAESYVEGDETRLLLHKSKLDGMKVLINELEQLVIKNNRS